MQNDLPSIITDSILVYQSAGSNFRGNAEVDGGKSCYFTSWIPPVLSRWRTKTFGDTLTPILRGEVYSSSEPYSIEQALYS